MLKRLLLAFSILSIVALSLMPAQAEGRESHIVGVVTKVEPNMLAVRTDGSETTSVTLTSETRYLKWIMAKPWQQDAHAHLGFVRVGSQVHIELAQDNSRSARIVWIVVGRPGID